MKTFQITGLNCFAVKKSEGAYQGYLDDSPQLKLCVMLVSLCIIAIDISFIKETKYN